MASAELHFADGWMGGSWKLNGKPVVFEVRAFNLVMRQHANEIFKKTQQVTPVIEAYYLQGEDNDHGHKYPWTGLRLRATVDHEGFRYYREITSVHLSDDLLHSLQDTKGLTLRTGS